VADLHLVNFLVIHLGRSLGNFLNSQLGIPELGISYPLTKVNHYISVNAVELLCYVYVSLLVGLLLCLSYKVSRMATVLK
jgi:hypothetical protein